MPIVQGQLEGDRLTELGFVNNERNDYYPNEDPVILESPTANWTPDQVAQNIPAKGIDLDKLTIDNFEINQYLKGGANGYDDGIGWFIGIDSTGISKLFFGDSDGDKVTWDGSSLNIVGGLDVSSLNIPDTTTDDSFHTDTSGNSWWGCNVADFATDNDNADAYILNTGESKFLNSIVDGTINGLTGFGGDGSDGALNVTSGTTTLNTDQVYNYSSITISSGATLKFTGTNGAGLMKCKGNCIFAGTIDLRGIITSPISIRTASGDSLESGSARATASFNSGGTGGIGGISPSGGSYTGMAGGVGGTSTTASASPGTGGAGGVTGGTPTVGSHGEGGDSSVGGGGGGGGGGGLGGTDGTDGSNNSGTTG